MNYRARYTHLSTKLNDVMYQKNLYTRVFFNPFSEKITQFCIYKKMTFKTAFIYFTFNLKFYGRRQSGVLSLTHDCEKARQLKHSS